MERQRRGAIARIAVVQGGVERSRGTGLLVADGLVLTALHVIADRRSDPPRFFSEDDARIEAVFPAATPGAAAHRTALEPLPRRWDRDDDWVLCRCAQAPPAAPLPLFELREDGGPWETYGYPDVNPDDGMVFSGQVRNHAGDCDGREALQLYSDEAAAGRGGPVPGLSGAPCLVAGAVVGLLRVSLLQDGRNEAGTLYATPIAAVLRQAADLLPGPDPYAGLPGVPVRDLPERPFRYLEPYAPEDAELFFGRGRELRALCRWLADGSAQPLLLLYGQSGVGKSSLLAAGLLPRLASSHRVALRRRDAAVGLAETLRLALDAAPGEALPAAWLRAVQAPQPLLVLLDQVEECFTRPGPSLAPAGRGLPVGNGGPAGTDELPALAAALRELFVGADPARPRGRLILSFRKEWLAEIDKALGERGVPRERLFIERLDREGVLEIIGGLARGERLRRRYHLDIEPGLPERIADDLLEDAGSPVAPTLQILLTKLWTAATSASPSAPRFTHLLYGDLHRRGLLLADFLRAQLDSLAQALPQASASGLALEVLAFHTSELGTAAQRTVSETLAAYRHQAAEVTPLLEALRARYLLSDPPGEVAAPANHLAHDTLAPLVRKELDESLRPGQAARRVLEARAGHGATPQPLDALDLAAVEAGLGGMRVLTPAEEQLLQASRRRRRRERLVRRLLYATGAAALLVLLGFTGYTLYQRQELQDRQWKLRHAAAEGFYGAASTAATLENDALRGLLLASKAVELAPDADPRLPAYLARVAHLSEAAPRRVLRLGEAPPPPGATIGPGRWVPKLARLSPRLDQALVYTQDGRLLLVSLTGGPERDLGRQDVPGSGFRAWIGLVKEPLWFDPWGRWAVAICGDTLRLWDAATGQPLLMLPAGEVKGLVQDTVLWELAATAEHLALLVRRGDRAVVLRWDPADPARRPCVSTPVPLGDLGRPDGTLLLPWAEQRWCDLPEPPPLRDSRGVRAEGHAVSADGRVRALFIRQPLYTAVEFQDAASGRRLGFWSLDRTLGNPTAVLDLSGNGQVALLEVASPSGPTLALLRRGEPALTALRPALERSRLWLNEDGTVLASVSDAGELSLWDTGHQRPLRFPVRLPEKVLDVAATPDRRSLRMFSERGRVYEWGLDRGGCHNEPPGDWGGTLVSADLHPSGDTLVALLVKGNRLRLRVHDALSNVQRWERGVADMAQSDPEHRQPGPQPVQAQVRFSADGTRLLVVTCLQPEDCRLSLWSPDGATVAAPITLEKARRVDDVAMARDGGNVVLALRAQEQLTARGPQAPLWIEERDLSTGRRSHCNVPSPEPLTLLVENGQYVQQTQGGLTIGTLHDCQPRGGTADSFGAEMARDLTRSYPRTRQPAAVGRTEQWLLGSSGAWGLRMSPNETFIGRHLTQGWLMTRGGDGNSARDPQTGASLCTLGGPTSLSPPGALRQVYGPPFLPLFLARGFAGDDDTFVILTENGEVHQTRLLLQDAQPGEQRWASQLAGALLGLQMSEDQRLLPAADPVALRRDTFALLRQAAERGEPRARFLWERLGPYASP